ncbi:hypothetical protein [Rummeliibacillus stabekisii]|uniref:hypothetical protein n=1 Tax=Rummeliibacillus stabekisii TaxID=241244 RepID=UPI003717FA4C
MGIIKATGSQAKENAKKSDLDLNKIYLRLKDGESHKVRVLHMDDYAEYTAVADYNLDIYTQAVSEDSPLLVAHAKGGEKFKDLYPRSRYVMVFGSLQTGQLVAWDCSKNQFKSMVATIEEYEDVIDEIGFNLKRTGSGASDTQYSLNPIIKMKADEKEVFQSLEGTEVNMEFYEAIIVPKSDTFTATLLKNAGFDVATHLPHIDLSETEEGEAEPDTSAEEISKDNQDENLLDLI